MMTKDLLFEKQIWSWPVWPELLRHPCPSSVRKHMLLLPPPCAGEQGLVWLSSAAFREDQSSQGADLEEGVLETGLLDLVGKCEIPQALLDLHQIWLQQLVLFSSHRIIVELVPPHEVDLQHAAGC